MHNCPKCRSERPMEAISVSQLPKVDGAKQTGKAYICGCCGLSFQLVTMFGKPKMVELKTIDEDRRRSQNGYDGIERRGAGKRPTREDWLGSQRPRDFEKGLKELYLDRGDEFTEGRPTRA